MLLQKKYLFYLSALLLGANDFYWKAAFHNALTGKISDFAGIALWVLFWESFGWRQRKVLYIGTAVLFAWFKSPYSEAFLQILNLSRVVDYTDLMALAVLPALYLLPFGKIKTAWVWKPNFAEAAIALFLFVATTPRKDEICCYFDKKYAFSFGKDTLFAHIQKKFPANNTVQDSNIYIGIKPQFCDRGVSAHFRYSVQRADSCTLKLVGMTSVCIRDDINAKDALQAVETLIIPKLK